MMRVTKEYAIDERGTARWNVCRWEGETFCESFSFPANAESRADEAMRQQIKRMEEKRALTRNARSSIY